MRLATLVFGTRTSAAVRALAMLAVVAALVLAHSSASTSDAPGGQQNACAVSESPWLTNGRAQQSDDDALALEASPPSAENEVSGARFDLRTVTYNIHSGLGGRPAFFASRHDVERNLRAIAQAIATAAPRESPIDVVALNEVDFGSRRSGWIDEAAYLADLLGEQTGHRYEVIRGETWRRDLPGFEVRFGNAALVRHPVVSAITCVLDDAASCAVPGISELPSLHRSGWINRLLGEPRGVIKLTLRLDGSLVDVLVTHLDAFLPSVREVQAVHVLRRFLTPERTTVLLGDVNAVPTDLTLARRFCRDDRTHDILMSGDLADTRITYAVAHDIPNLRSWATFPARAPIWPLDAAFASLDLVPADVAIIGNDASDHRGLSVHLRGVGNAHDLVAARARHARIRRGQVDRILLCDVEKGRRSAQSWLITATGFAALLADQPGNVAVGRSATGS